MKDKFNKYLDLITGKEMSTLPSALAFSLFLSAIPIISIIFYVATTLHVSAETITTFINKTFTSGTAELLQPIIFDSINISSLITMIFAIIVATNGCHAIIIASNTIYNIENASFYKRTVKSIILVVILILLLMFIVIVPLLGNIVYEAISSLKIFKNNDALFKSIYFILQVPISISVVFALTKSMYAIAPDQNIKGSYVNRGALFTTMGWLIITTIFSYYIKNIARYDLVYGNLANIVMLLFWFYLLAYIFVIGLELNKKTVEKNIEKTNIIKLKEIREKVKEKEK